MSGLDPHPDDRLLQLLADRATEGVDKKEAVAMDELLSADPTMDAEALDRVAAKIAIAMIPEGKESLPSALRIRLLTDAEAFFSSG